MHFIYLHDKQHNNTRTVDLSYRDSNVQRFDTSPPFHQEKLTAEISFNKHYLFCWEELSL